MDRFEKKRRRKGERKKIACREAFRDSLNLVLDTHPRTRITSHLPRRMGLKSSKGERERERNEEEGEGGREYEQRRRYIYFARTREREDLLGGQISRRRRGCGQEMGTIRSYTPEGTERRAENSWSYLAVFQRASLVYLATGGGRGDEGSRYVVERQPGSPTGSRL